MADRPNDAPPTSDVPPKKDPHKRTSAPPYGRQLLFSLLTAVAIVIVTVAIVTAAIGPGPDWEELYDTRSERRDLVEERQEAREERLEEQEDAGSR
jgi:hypothetical protein